MVADPTNEPTALNESDRRALTQLVNAVALSDSALMLFAIAPESAPSHPVVEAFQTRLRAELEESLHFSTFRYSDDSLFNFLAARVASPDDIASGREVIFAFGLEQLPTPRKKQEIEQLNLAREKLFEQNIIIVFWLNRESFLAEFRARASDFWDWRGKVAVFEARHQLLYPYLEWLVSTNSYLTMNGVMQVNRQVDIFLDQIYVSLQAERKQQVSASPAKQARELTGQGVSVAKGGTALRSTQTRSVRSSASDGVHKGPDGRENNFSELEFGDEVAFELVSESPFEVTPEILDVEVSTTKTVTERVDLSDVVRGQFACSVILGAPGAGKTTLLKFLALHFAKAVRDGHDTVSGEVDGTDLGAVRLPIFFKIADYAEQLEHHPEISLLDYLQQFYRQWEASFEGDRLIEADISVVLLEQMRLGNCLILLDGLDEVFDQESRRQIVARINEFSEQFGHNNKLIVTSRIAGYQEVKLASRFAEFTITDMSDKQVSNFLHRWCAAVEKAQKPDAAAGQQVLEGKRQAEQILRDIQQNESVKRLTTNPLLLTILALIHRNGERLPERRVRLYELAVQTLTADWQLGKKLPNMQKILLPEGEVVGLLAPLAYWMHEEKPSGQVAHREVVQQLAPKLAELRGESDDSPEILQAVEEFLRRVRETTGLFVERSPDVYGFMHLTFEEYFAAREIADQESTEILKTIWKYWEEPRWEEPVLLALGYFGSYSYKRFNWLAEQLFEGLADYQPSLDDEIVLRGGDSPNAQICWTPVGNLNESREFRLKELLFAGQVVAQVGEVNVRLRKDLIQKLVVTGLTLEDDTVLNQMLRLLRRIDSFNQQGEVVAALQRVIENGEVKKEIRLKAQVTKLYVLCCEASNDLLTCVNTMVSYMEPSIFSTLKGVVEDIGEEMSPALETLRQQLGKDSVHQSGLVFITAVTYLRKKHYDKSVALLESLSETRDDLLVPYISWSLGVACQGKEEYDKANGFYQLCSEQLIGLTEPEDVLTHWEDWGVCQRLDKKYEQAIDCFQQMFAIANASKRCEAAALALFRSGYTYQSWGKYEEAIAQHEKSRDLYQQLGKETDVANLWYNLADCYRDWGKYEEAISAQQEDLALREKLDDQPNIADAYYQFGRIYQSWGKYEEAIAQHEQSRDLYQQLGKETDVAYSWYWIAACYQDWGKYEEAVTAQRECLALREKLDDQSRIASAYYQFGRIYQSWGKYEEAIAQHEQSRDLYQQLGKETDVSNLWYWIAACYQDWGKYEEAVTAQRECLALREKLDDQSRIASAYYQFGRIYQSWGKYEEAIAQHEQSRDLYQQLGKETDVSNLWYWIAVCYQDWGKYEEAVTAQQEYLALREKLDDQSRIALAYYQFGRIYQAWGKYEEAIVQHEKSRDLNQQLGKETNISTLWNWIAACYRDWGKYEEAITAQRECLALREKLDDQSRIALAYYQFGRIYQAWGKYEEAIVQHEKSRDLYQQLGKETDVANLWYNLADCYRDWSKYEKAISAQQEDLALREKLDDQPNIADAYYQFGRIYQSWGKYEEAIAQHEKSRDLYQQLGKETNVANQWYNLAGCYRDWGKYEEAISAQQEDLALREKLDDQPNIAYAYYQFGRIYQSWGKYEEAIAQHEKSRDLYQQLGKETNVANQWYNLAGCYRDWGKYEEAISAQQEDLALREKLDDQPNIADAYYQFGRIYQAWGKYEEAISQHEKSRDLYQQLGKETNVASQWYNLAGCYRDWGKYEEAISAQQEDLALREKLDDQPRIALAYYQFGRIYQAWGKYEEAISFHEQSRKIYQILDLTQREANQLFWLADCYRDLKDYAFATEYFQKSSEQHQSIGHLDATAKRLRQLAKTQLLQSKESSLEQSKIYLQQADYNLQKAIQINTAGDYQQNLAYDHIVLAVWHSEQLRHRPEPTSIHSEHITQFEQAATTAFTHFANLGKSLNSAEEALDIARAYLEIPLLQNLPRAEEIARQSLKTFQTFNRKKLQAAAYYLLGEIYLSPTHPQEAHAAETAHHFLTQSVELYQTLDIATKVTEVQQLIDKNA